MFEITFTVPGRPRGGARPRVVRNGRHVHAFMPKNDAEYRHAIALAARKALKASHESAACVSFSVSIVAWFLPAKSWTISKKRAALRQEFPPGKPDADNIAKIVLDGITESGLWPDDRFVSDLCVTKRWGVGDMVGVYVSGARLSAPTTTSA